MRDVIDATILFIEGVNLTEASVTIESRLGFGDKYTFNLGDQFVCAEIFFEYVRIEYATDVIFEVDYIKAKKTFTLQIFRTIMRYLSDEHA